MPSTVYCDEAGHTGSHLLDVQQPYFVYAGVAIEPGDARDLVGALISTYRVEGELKAERLVKYKKGRKVIDTLISTLRDRARIVVYHKRYALCGKFFEFAFEPVLAPNSMPYYDIGLHRFVAGALYSETLAPSASENALLALTRFQQIARGSVDAAVASITPDNPDRRSILNLIADWVKAHEAQILEEVEGFRGDNGRMDPWVLDLSSGAMFSILAAMGTRHGQIKVICDQSLPLDATRDFFNVNIGRTETPTMRIGGAVRPLGWNMSEQILFASSRETPGLQLADVLAGVMAYSLTNRRADGSQEWREALLPCVQDDSVLAEPDEIDLDTRSGFVNALVLLELVTRSKKRQNLHEGMDKYIARALWEYERRK